MYSYDPLKSGQTSFAELAENFVVEVLPSAEKREKAKQELESFFRGAEGDERIDRFRFTHWGVYTILNWQDIYARKPVIFAEIIKFQCVDAARLGFDIVEILMLYLGNVVYLEDEIINFYTRLRNDLLVLDDPIGVFENSTISLAELLNKIKLLESFPDNSMEVASFYEKTKHLLYPDNYDDTIENFWYVDREKALADFIDFLHLIVKITPDQIWDFLQDYLSADSPLTKMISTASVKDIVAKIMAQAAVEAKVAVESATAEEIEEEILPAVSAPAKLDVKPPAATQGTTSGRAAEPPYAVIRDKIDAAFEKEDDGSYKDLDLVMNALQKAAEKYNDPKIAELYYFDEKEGKFVWNV